MRKRSIFCCRLSLFMANENGKLRLSLFLTVNSKSLEFNIGYSIREQSRFLYDGIMIYWLFSLIDFSENLETDITHFTYIYSKYRSLYKQTWLRKMIFFAAVLKF